MYPLIEYFNGLDSGICMSINRLSHRSSIRTCFSIVSRLGDGGYWLLAGVLLLYLRGGIAWPMIGRMAVTTAIGILLYKYMKNRLVRERPYITHSNILCGTPPLDRYSFPSGHTLHATSFAVMFSTYEPLLLIVVVPFALLVAASRIILGLHYPSDVAAGALIGFSLASASLSIAEISLI